MKRAEVIKLIGICSVNYRNWPEEGKEEAATLLWLKMLEDTPFFIAEAAIEKYIAESVYPPTIADIRARIADMTTMREKTPIEAWGDVCQAIRRFGHPSPKEAMESLNPLTRKVVESIGYMTLCRSENEMADRAHFLKVYEVLAKRERDDSLMLQSTKDTMFRIQNGETEIDQMRRIKQTNS